jgi:hypothetical protein
MQWQIDETIFPILSYSCLGRYTFYPTYYVTRNNILRQFSKELVIGLIVGKAIRKHKNELDT